MPLIYGYVRCSHLDSKESGLGLAVQRQQIKAAADALTAREPGLKWFGLFEDKAVSAFTKPFRSRPAGRELLDRLSEGDVVIFAKADRAFRSVRDFSNTSAVWEALGVRPVYL